MGDPREGLLGVREDPCLLRGNPECRPQNWGGGHTAWLDPAWGDRAGSPSHTLSTVYTALDTKRPSAGL